MVDLDMLVQSWTVPEVRKDLVNMNSDFIKAKIATITSLATAIIGLVALASGSSLLPGAAIFLLLNCAVVEYYDRKITKIKNKFDGLELTSSKLTEIGINEFGKGIEEIQDWGKESSKALSLKISPFLDSYVGNMTTFGDSKDAKNAGICIVEGSSLNDHVKIALLDAAVAQKIPLFFASLQNHSSTTMKANSFGYFQGNQIKQKIKESAFLSAGFIKACLEDRGELTQDLCAINRQLKALSFKYYGRLDDSATIETISPTFQLRREDHNRIVIEMIANKMFPGAEGDMNELIEILDHDNETIIEVVGEGWRDGLKVKTNNWQEFMQRYTMTTKCVSIIRDKSTARDDIPFWA